MTRFTIAVVSAGVSRESATRRLATAISAQVQDQLYRAGHAADLRTIEVARLAADVAAAAIGGPASLELQRALNEVERADGLIVATPVYKGGYSGLFKSFFDCIDQYALARTPVVLAATGGGPRHALVVETQLRPLFGFFQALTVPTGVYSSGLDCATPTEPNDDLALRIDQAGEEFAQLLAATRDRAWPPLTGQTRSNAGFR